MPTTGVNIYKFYIQHDCQKCIITCVFWQCLLCKTLFQYKKYKKYPQIIPTLLWLFALLHIRNGSLLFVHFQSHLYKKWTNLFSESYDKWKGLFQKWNQQYRKYTNYMQTAYMTQPSVFAEIIWCWECSSGYPGCVLSQSKGFWIHGTYLCLAELCFNYLYKDL